MSNKWLDTGGKNRGNNRKKTNQKASAKPNSMEEQIRSCYEKVLESSKEKNSSKISVSKHLEQFVASEIENLSKNEERLHYGLYLDKYFTFFDRQSLLKQGGKFMRQKNTARLFASVHGYELIDFSAKVKSRLIVGLGEHSIQETDIRIHHTYGVPYIPATAIKGCLRAHWIKKYFDYCEQRASEDPLFQNVFGVKTEEAMSEKRGKGNVIFTDTFPADSFRLVQDVMTPHQKIFKQGQAQFEKVVPILFLALEETFFQMQILIDSKNFENTEKDIEVYSSALERWKISKDRSWQPTEIKNFLEHEMKDMLENHGLGAKTSVGYGFFEVAKK